MPQVKGFQSALPPECFWMLGEALFVLSEDVPESMEFTVFAEEMLPAEFVGRNVPNSH